MGRRVIDMTTDAEILKEWHNITLSIGSGCLYDGENKFIQKAAIRLYRSRDKEIEEAREAGASALSERLEKIFKESWVLCYDNGSSNFESVWKSALKAAQATTTEKEK